ncbi:hypothetical protein Tco_0880341, partial [Tanacetum coccineum]
VRPSSLPDSWKLKEVFAICIILGGYLPLMTDNEGYQFSSVYSEKIHGTSRSVSQRCWTRKKKPYKFLHIILRSEKECKVREYTAEEQWLLTETES